MRLSYMTHVFITRALANLYHPTACKISPFFRAKWPPSLWRNRSLIIAMVKCEVVGRHQKLFYAPESSNPVDVFNV